MESLKKLDDYCNNRNTKLCKNCTWGKAHGTSKGKNNFSGTKEWYNGGRKELFKI